MKRRRKRDIHRGAKRFADKYHSFMWGLDLGVFIGMVIALLIIGAVLLGIYSVHA